MTPFTRHTGIAAALPWSDVNTDLIYPQRFLRRTDLDRMGAFLFHGLRFDEDGRERDDFVLNREPWRHASILVAGHNFGSGSSREHAPWALEAFGIRCIVSSLFADIFEANCINNMILPATVRPADLERCLALAAEPATATLSVDLEAQTIRSDALGTIDFEIAPSNRRRLLDGTDSIDETLRHLARIEAFEAAAAEAEPWLVPTIREA